MQTKHRKAHQSIVPAVVWASIAFIAVIEIRPAAGAVTVQLSPSRTNGVAPLAVFFDATGTTATSTTRPFHDLDYTWTFGDPASGSRSTSGRSKNQAKGAVAAHVFEK